jgi:hypothetical protein
MPIIVPSATSMKLTFVLMLVRHSLLSTAVVARHHRHGDDEGADQLVEVGFGEESLAELVLLGEHEGRFLHLLEDGDEFIDGARGEPLFHAEDGEPAEVEEYPLDVDVDGAERLQRDVPSVEA